MAINPFKCFICDMPSVAMDKYLGLNIAVTLAMPLSAVLEKCLRVVADVEKEYFCTKCSNKIEEYDRLMWQSRQIEKDLHEQFQNKYIKFDLDDSNGQQIIWDRDRVNEVLIETATQHDLVTIDSKFNIKTFNPDSEQQNERYNKEEQEFCSDINQAIKMKKRKKKTNSRTFDPTLKSTIEEENVTNKWKPKSEKLHYLKETVTCDYCGRTYQSKGALSVHIVKHIGKSPYECNVCKKTFTQRGGLLRHMRIHNGEQPHQCELCGKRFIHTASFNMHKKIHVDERSKTCTVCGSKFRSSSHMSRHIRTHTGEKPFACETCGQKFAQRYNLKTHQKIHEKDQGESPKNYKCLVCPQVFVRREKLNEHLVQAHQAIETSIPLDVFSTA